MAKQVKKAAKKEAVEMVGGAFRSGSAVANVYEALEDGRFHTLASLKPTCKGADLLNRISLVRRTGRNLKKWDVIKDGDNRVKLVFGKPSAKASRASDDDDERPAKKSKHAAGKKPHASASKKPSVQDVPTDED